jgi:hypothetical protein
MNRRSVRIQLWSSTTITKGKDEMDMGALREAIIATAIVPVGFVMVFVLVKQTYRP